MMPNVTIIDALLKLISSNKKLESQITPQVLEILADLALYSTLSKNIGLRANYIATLQKFLAKNRPMLLISSAAIDKAAAIRLILSFAIGK